MKKDFSKLDEAKLDLIRMKSRLEELQDMTLRDYEAIDHLEKEMGKKILWIKELQEK